MATAHTRTFGDLLRHSRLAAGLTLEELAERSGLSAKGIGALERGERRAPRRDTVALLADALHLADADRIRFESAARQRTPLPVTSAVVAAPSANLSPLIGRTAELAHIERLLAGEGPPVLLLSGEPGIGKTRLLHETAAMGRTGGWCVLEGGCHRRSGQEPYAPILGALERRIHGQSPAQLRVDLEGCSWLARLLPELYVAALVPNAPEMYSPVQERRLMFAAVGRFLRNIAGTAGTLLVLDDLQWIDGDALDLLAMLIRASSSPADTSEPPLRIVGAYRGTEVQSHDPLGALQHDLIREGMAVRRDVSPLRSEDASLLLSRLLSVAVAQESMSEVRTRVLQRAGGLPLFLVSYAQRLDAVGLDGGDLAVVLENVPEDIAESIRQQVAALPSNAQTLLGIAAVTGRSASYTVLLAVARSLSLSESDALDGLHGAVQARLLLEGAGGAYSFPHDLIHEVITSDLGFARASVTHYRIAEALEGLPDANRHSAELAWHFAQGGAPDRAFPYALQAGVQAEAVYANAEAERQYEAAAELARGIGDQAREGAALERLGLLHWWNTGEYALTIAAHEQALQVYRTSGNRESEIRTAAQLARAYARCSRQEAGLALLTSFLVGPYETESMSERPEIQARLLAALADVHFHSGSYREQSVSAEQAVRMWRTIGDKAPLADALVLHGVALRLLGQWQEALGLLREAVSLAEQTGSLYVCAFAWNHIGYSYLQSGQFDMAATAIERGRDLGERIRNVSFYGASRFLLGLHAFYAGDWAAARMWFDRTASVLDGKAYSVIAYGPLGQGIIHVMAGESEIGLSYLRETIALKEQGGMPHIIDRARRELAEAELVMGNTNSARSLLEPDVTQPGRQDENDVTPMMPLLAWAYLELGLEQASEALLNRAAAQALIQHHQIALIDALRVRGLLYTTQRRWPEATGALEEALALARGMSCPYAEAKALYAYGQSHRARGEPERARENFTAALVILNRLGERLYAEHIERALAEIDE